MLQQHLKSNTECLRHIANKQILDQILKISTLQFMRPAGQTTVFDAR